MIQVEGLNKSYMGETVLEGLSFKLNKGERCGLIGRNGSGKTTLLRMITGEEKPDGGIISAPKFYSIGYLNQHLKFTQETVLQEAALGLRPQDEDQLHKVEKILFGLGFKEEDLYASPAKFSGGYQLRIHLTKVLVGEPDCLLLDEPTNYLDIVSVRWFGRFLRSWKGELIIISHDREFMDSVTTHTLGVHRKGIRKTEGGTEKFYTQLLQEEEIYERTRMNMEKKRDHLQSFVDRFGAKASKAGQARSRTKAIGRMPVLEQLAQLHHLDFDFSYAPLPGEKLLEVNEVSFAYERETPIIQNFSLRIEKNDRIAVVGKNGRGKSTFLRLIAQELEPDQGTVRASNNAKIGYFGQTNIERLRPNMTVEEEIASVRPGMTFTEVRGICGIMMFSDDNAKKKISVLSGGERSRVLLGKILATPCNLLLLDEPTNHLDMESIEALLMALDSFEGAVVIVTHSEMFLRQVPSKFVICHQGNQHLFLGGYEEFLEKEGWEQGSEKAVKVKLKPEERRENKQKRTELINSKSKALQPIQKKMDRIEAEVMALDQENEKAVHDLIALSQKGDGLAIATLSRTIDDKKRKLDLLFAELEQLALLYEETKVSFDKQLEK